MTVEKHVPRSFPFDRRTSTDNKDTSFASSVRQTARPSLPFQHVPFHINEFPYLFLFQPSIYSSICSFLFFFLLLLLSDCFTFTVSFINFFSFLSFSSLSSLKLFLYSTPRIIIKLKSKSFLKRHFERISNSFPLLLSKIKNPFFFSSFKKYSDY